MPAQPRTDFDVQSIERGGYVLRNGDDPADIAILATGSEVQLAMRAAALLESGRHRRAGRLDAERRSRSSASPGVARRRAAADAFRSWWSRQVSRGAGGDMRARMAQ